jgi:DNA-binding transcriptional MocR family regulator
VRHGVTFIAGDAFYPTAPERVALRLSFGLIDPDNIAAGAQRLGDLVRDLLGHTMPASIFL